MKTGTAYCNMVDPPAVLFQYRIPPISYLSANCTFFLLIIFGIFNINTLITINNMNYKKVKNRVKASEKQTYNSWVDEREKGAKAIYETYKLLRTGPLQKVPEWNDVRAEIYPIDPEKCMYRKTLPNIPIRITAAAKLCECERSPHPFIAYIQIDALTGDDISSPDVWLRDLDCGECIDPDSLNCWKGKEIEKRIKDVFSNKRKIYWEKNYYPP